MDENNYQIIRKDAKNCFVESLNDAFKIGKIHLNFATYDLSRPSGKRQTNNVAIYIPVYEFMELHRKLICRQLNFILNQKKKNGDSSPIYQTLGGTSAKRLKELKKSRENGKIVSRVASVIVGQKSDSYLLQIVGLVKRTKKG